MFDLRYWLYSFFETVSCREEFIRIAGRLLERGISMPPVT
jgi:hypothetical protein